MPDALTQRLSHLVQRARCAPHGDAVATELLDSLRALFEDGLSAPLTGTPFRLLRGMVHLRPGGTYRQLTLCHWDPDTAAAGDAPGLAPSATLWRFVHERNVAVALDVVVAQIMIDDAAPIALEAPEYAVSNGHGATLGRLADRQTTHVFALPVRGRGDAVLGMVSIEAQCNARIGAGLPWAAVVAAQLMVDTVSAALLDTPRPPPAEPTPDPALPVVGVRMREAMALVRAFAAQEATILLTGPTGSGKSQLATYVHDHSPMARGPFVSFSLHGVNEDLQLGHLKGWRRSAFTGATDQTGLLESAANGTLFVDEIQNLSLLAQTGLLQLLSTRRYQVLGEPQERHVDNVRFIFASNADLALEVAAGRFRKDLYYRINVLSVELPGLGERRDEIPGWARFMAQRAHSKARLPGVCRVAEQAVAWLSEQHWEGNLRELENVVLRAHALAAAARDDPGGVEVTLADVLRALGAAVPAEQDGDVYALLQRAARLINRRSLTDLAAGREPLGDYVRQNNVLFAMQWHEAAEADTLAPATIAALLGKERSVQQRNYAKELKREQQRLADFTYRLNPK